MPFNSHRMKIVLLAVFMLVLFTSEATECKTSTPSSAKDGMVWIPAGEFLMGSKESADGGSCSATAPTSDSQPIHRVYVDGFWMDRTEVTNEQFEEFVKATGYQTVAERAPVQAEFPDSPKENLLAGSIVFNPTERPVPLDDALQWWSYQPGVNWRHPEGPRSDLKGRERYPVVHIAYDDAVAYSHWCGKRLPTEAEWEYAARGGKANMPFTWGRRLKPKNKWMANIYQGNFPVSDTGEDGFIGVAPVAQFPPNGYGLYDMAGNVWEWCNDWYRVDYYSQLKASTSAVVRNPQGPSDCWDPAEPHEKKRVQRGGSFLCSNQYCERYKIGTRGKGQIETSTNHVGFRCVRSGAAAADSYN